MGIDIGSTTVKVVVIDNQNNIVFSQYKRHFSEIKRQQQNCWKKQKMIWEIFVLVLCFTGSGGVSIAKVIKY